MFAKIKKKIGLFFAFVFGMLYALAAQAETLVFDPAIENKWYNRGVFYGRGLQLQTDEAGEHKGRLYATSEYYYYPGRYGLEHFPIFESADGGKTWTHISDVYDTEFTKKQFKKADDGSYYKVPEGSSGATTYYNEWWSMSFEPQLFELPDDLGSLKKGTVLCGGISKNNDRSALVVYCSTDGLRSWKYLSTITLGGKEETGKGTAIWEPFFVYENNALYCFYSDERGMTAGGGQRLVFQKSADGITWGGAVKVCDFESENNKYRPGMPTVTKLPDGRYFMLYEGVNMGGGLPTYYKLTDNIEEWRPSEREDGTLPAPFNGGSPYCTAMPDGTLVVGAHGTNKIAVNTDSLKTNTWTILNTNIGNAYTRSLAPMMNGQLLIVSGGAFGAENPHKLTASVEDIKIPCEIDLRGAKVTGSAPWSENYANSAKNVVDGDGTSYFDGNPDGYVIIDLGEEYTISGIGYQPRFDFGFRLNGGIFYGSTDGKTWTEIHRVTQDAANSVITYDKVNKNTCRYIKYTSDGKNYCNIAEIKLYSEDIKADSLALHKTVKSSHSEDLTTTAENAVDGNMYTRWSGYNANGASWGNWIEIDLGEGYHVTRVELSYYKGAERDYSYEIYTLGDVANSYWSDKNRERDFLAQGYNRAVKANSNYKAVARSKMNEYARYISVKTTASAGGFGPSLWEIKVYGWHIASKHRLDEAAGTIFVKYGETVTDVMNGITLSGEAEAEFAGNSDDLAAEGEKLVITDGNGIKTEYRVVREYRTQTELVPIKNSFVDNIAKKLLITDEYAPGDIYSLVKSEHYAKLEYKDNDNSGTISDSDSLAVTAEDGITKAEYAIVTGKKNINPLSAEATFVEKPEHSAEKICDNNLATRWCAYNDGMPQAVMIDLGRARSVGGITTYWYGENRSNLYDIYITDTPTVANGKFTVPTGGYALKDRYTDVSGIQGIENKGVTDIVAAEGRYITIYCRENSANIANIWEAELYLKEIGEVSVYPEGQYYVMNSRIDGAIVAFYDEGDNLVRTAFVNKGVKKISRGTKVKYAKVFKWSGMNELRPLNKAVKVILN